MKKYEPGDITEWLIIREKLSRIIAQVVRRDVSVEVSDYEKAVTRP
jgi:hypothetical protein